MIKRFWVHHRLEKVFLNGKAFRKSNFLQPTKTLTVTQIHQNNFRSNRIYMSKRLRQYLSHQFASQYFRLENNSHKKTLNLVKRLSSLINSLNRTTMTLLFTLRILNPLYRLNWLVLTKVHERR